MATTHALLLLAFLPSRAGDNLEDEISGPLGLSELIAIALKNDPTLVELRGEITIAEALKQAEKDWRDPELRFSRSYDNDVELERPYERTVTETSTDRITGTQTDADGKRFDSGTVTRTETTRSTVTPGATSDVIREQTIQNERTTLNRVTDPSRPFSLNTTETVNETQNLKRDAYIEDFHGRDPLARDDDYEFTLRFYPPHPWERAARLRRAQAEINAARAALIAAEREVIIEVRRLYEEVQYLKAAAELEAEAISADSKYAEDLRGLVEARLVTRDKVAMAGMQALTGKLKLGQRKLEYDNALGTLAAYTGVRNASRILVSSRIARPNLTLSSNQLDYYIQMALASRGDLQEIASKGQIAEAELAEVKALYIPWLSFIDLDYGVRNTGGYRNSDNYGFQLGVTVPAFTWLGHQKEAPEAAISSYFSQLGTKKEQITGQVVNAYRNIQGAIAHKAEADALHDKLMAMIGAEPEMEIKAEDAAKLAHDFASEKSNLDKLRLEAHRAYNQALILFEEALGADIDAVFNMDGKSAGPEVSAVPLAEPETEAAAAPMKALPVAPSVPVAPAEVATPKEKTEAAPVEEAAPSEKSGIFSRPAKRSRPGSRR